MINLRRFVRADVVAGVGVLLSAYALTQVRTAQSPGRTPLSSTRTLGAARTYQNLSIIPVYDSSAEATDTYVTLDEGLRAGTVTVNEAGNGGDVNTLYVSNTGRKPLYIMAGEVVLGGQQDRCLGKDMVIYPGKKRVPVSVFCVEHGRWAGSGAFEGSAKMVASAGIRADAQDGAFVADAPAAASPRSEPGFSPRGREEVAAGSYYANSAARVSASQSRVWDKVAKKNAAFAASPSTGTYKEVLNQTAGQAANTIGPYVKALLHAFKSDPHLVGVVAAVNGKVIASDTFGDPTLFRKLWPKLLNSYAADAAENYSPRSNVRATVSGKEARDFLQQSARATSKAEARTANGVAQRYESRDAVSYKLMERTKGAGGHPATASPGGSALHENVLRKN